jgi:hypothetical protein
LAGNAHRQAAAAHVPGLEHHKDKAMNHSLTLATARSQYWQANGFGDDGGDSLDWIPIKLWKLTVKIPNTEGRRRAVRLHDLHHVVTGYRTDLAGESEIAAWELASGCFRWPAAFVLNQFALAMGLVVAPRSVMQAWARGRATRNLYRFDGVDELLPRTVDEVRSELGLDAAPPKVRVRDVLAASLSAVPAAAVMLAPLAALAAIFLQAL